MSDDFYSDAARRRMELIQAERAAVTADLQAARANSDYDAAAQSVQALADLDAAAANLGNLYERHRDSQRPQQDYASAEQRQARQPNEMTSQDVADLMNTSRHRGRGFTADDYNRLRSGLGWYKSARGVEQK